MCANSESYAILYKPEKETDVAAVTSSLKPRKQSNSMNKLLSPMTLYLRHFCPDYGVGLTIMQIYYPACLSVDVMQGCHLPIKYPID